MNSPANGRASTRKGAGDRAPKGGAAPKDGGDTTTDETAPKGAGDAVTDEAGERIVYDEDVTIHGHDLVVRDDDRREVARLGQGHLELTDRVRLNRFGLELFDLEQRSAVRITSEVLDISIDPDFDPTDFDPTDGPILGGGGTARSDATLRVGTTGVGGHIQANDARGRRVLHLDGEAATLTVGCAGAAGDVNVVDGEGREVVGLHSGSAMVTVGAEGNEGDVVVRGVDGRDAVTLDGGNASLTVGVVGSEGTFAVLDHDGRDALRVNGVSGTVTIGNTNGNRPGDLILRDLFGHRAIWATGEDAVLRVGGEGQEGDLIVRDAVGRDAMYMNGQDAILIVGAEGVEGDIIVRDDTGADRIQLNGATGDIKLLGADLAEDFDVTADLAPGAVVVAVGPDEVAESTTAFDRRVVGVVSGAGDLQPALRLATRPGGRRAPVALVGRVYCQVDAGPGAIDVGDLLTTSDTAGHARRVDGDTPAAGTVLGKALAPLAAGTGLVPVLLMLR